MKRSNLVLYISFLLLMVFNLQAQDSTKSKTTQVQHGQHFVDKNGDGYNDNAPDHDGDGIPNGLDKDWLKFKKMKKRRHAFIDLNGDGINDNLNNTINIKNLKNLNQLDENNGSSINSNQQQQNRQQRKKSTQAK